MLWETVFGQQQFNARKRENELLQTEKQKVVRLRKPVYLNRYLILPEMEKQDVMITSQPVIEISSDFNRTTESGFKMIDRRLGTLVCPLPV